MDHSSNKPCSISPIIMIPINHVDSLKLYFIVILGYLAGSLMDLLMEDPRLNNSCLSRHLGSPAKVTKGARSLTLRYCPLQERKAYCVS